MDLSKLPVDGGVRQRGEQATRLETFPGFIYFSLNIATPLLEAWSRRLQARMPAEGAA